MAVSKNGYSDSEEYSEDGTESSAESDIDTDANNYSRSDGNDDDQSSTDGNRDEDGDSENGSSGLDDEDDVDDEDSDGSGASGSISEIEDDDEEVESDDDVTTFSAVDVSAEVEKGKGIMAQSGVWDALMSCRIKSQDAAVAMNQLPQVASGAFIESCSDAAEKAKSILEKTLGSLFQLQDEFLLARMDTAFISDQKSSADEDVRLKRKLEDYPEILAKRQKLLGKYRDDVLTSKALPPGSSPLLQIHQILREKERLVRRTQLIRSSLPILGKAEDVSQQDSAAKGQQFDREVFDDGDFYGKLLTQHISSKTANMADLSAVSKQWVEIEKLKRNRPQVERKASKGRKTRYSVHRKLLNFMISEDNPHLYSDEQRDALALEVLRDETVVNMDWMFV